MALTAEPERMPKKKRMPDVVTEPTGSARIGEHSVESLKAQAQRIRHYAAELEGIAERSAGFGITSLTVDGTTKLERGVTLIRDFMAALEYALVKARHSQL